MTKFKVFITRETSESVEVIVEAKDLEEADQKAYERVRDAMSAPAWPDGLEWEPDDYAGDPYLPAPGEGEVVPDTTPVS